MVGYLYISTSMFTADNEVVLVVTAGAGDKLLRILARPKVDHSKSANLECSLKESIALIRSMDCSLKYKIALLR